MDIDYLVALHKTLCEVHNSLTRKVLAMPHTDPLYLQAGATADAILEAAESAYAMFVKAHNS